MGIIPTMTFVVRRPGGGFEIRESLTTPAGPRARSLAAFRILNEDVLDRAERAATKAFDREHVVAAARQAGAPVEDTAANRAARELVAQLVAGRVPAPGLRRLLIDGLERAGPTRRLEAGDLALWVGASLADRGRTLRDLLELGDHLPASTRSRLRFPGFHRSAK